MDFDPNCRHAESAAAGKNLAKQNDERPAKSFHWACLCQLTPRKAKQEQETTKQHRRQRQILHHVKGNIFKKHSHTEELLRHQQKNLHRAVCHLQDRSDEHTSSPCATPFTHFFLKQLHGNLNVALLLLNQLNWNITTLKWHISEMAEQLFVVVLFPTNPFNRTTNKNLDHLQTHHTTWLVKINCLQSCQNARDVHRSFLHRCLARHRLRLFECVCPDEWNVCLLWVTIWTQLTLTVWKLVNVHMHEISFKSRKHFCRPLERQYPRVEEGELGKTSWFQT